MNTKPRLLINPNPKQTYHSKFLSPCVIARVFLYIWAMELAIRLFLLAWFFTHFEPIKDQITDLYSKYFGTWLQQGFEILSCFRCLSFWIVLIGTFDPFYAVGASFIATIYQDVIERWNNTIRAVTHQPKQADVKSLATGVHGTQPEPRTWLYV